MDELLARNVLLQGQQSKSSSSAAGAAATPPLDKGAPFYVVVALDGTVYRSGPGMPKWNELANEFQPVDSTVTKITGV